ncbi:MAG: hypothetical protein FWE95_09000, partial [Planctomycetaceae bacterium]|nr:hypothetical protein [Planctomycetaceae bacterium]
MKPTSKKFRGLVAATLGLTVSLTLPVVFSGNVLLAQGVPTQNVAFRDPFQGSAPVTAPQTPPSVVSPQVRQEADQKLHAARKAIIVKDIATAERLVNEVAALQLTYQEREDSPARVQGVIQEFKRLAQMRQTQGGGNEMFRRDYAKFCLIHADTMLLRGELDLAAGLTQEAVDQRVQFNQADREKGLEPNAMFLKIADARRIQGMNNASAVAVQAPVQSLSHASQMQLGQAVQMLDQARQALNGGQIEQAEHLARRADAFSLPEAAYPPGNSPNRLLNEIAARRQGVSIPVNPPVNPQMAQMNQPSDAHSAFLRSSQDQSHIVQTSASNQTLAPPVPVLSRNTPYIDETLQQQRMIQGQFQSMVIQELANAHRMVQEQRRPDIALETLYNLKRRVDQSQQLDSATRQMYAVQIDRAIEETISFQRRYAAQARQDQHNEAVLAGLRHDAEMFQQKEQQLQQMFIEHKKLLDEQRYEEALRIAKQAYDIAPDEPAVAAMLTLTTFAFNISRSQSIEGQKREGFIESLLAVDRASRVPNFGRDGDMIFPDNWAELVKIRTASNQALIQQRPDTEKRIIRQLETPVVLNANQPLTLEQALNLLCGQVDIIPHIDRTAFQQEDIQTGSMVFMPPANGITARSVLSALLDQYGLTYVVKNEMLTITTKRRAQGSKIVRMHYVGDIALEIPIPRESSPVDDAIYRSWMLMSRDPSPMATMMLQQAPHVSPAANMMMMQSPNVSPIPPGPMRQPQQPGIPAFNDNFSYNGNGRAPNAMYPNAAGDPNVLAQYLSQYGGGYGGGMGGGYGGGMMGGGGYGGGMMGGGGYGGGMMGGGGYGGGMMGGMMGGMGGMGMNFGSIMGIITSVIEPESWQDGDAFMDMHYATQSLAIRQTEEVHAQIEDLL